MKTRAIELTGACPGDAAIELRGEQRFCHTCRKVVHDMRGATRAKVLALVDENGGSACAWIELSPMGEPKFAPEAPSRLAKLATGAALAMGLSACQGSSSEISPPAPVELSPESANRNDNTQAPEPPPVEPMQPVALEPAAIEPAAIEPAAIEPAAIEPVPTSGTDVDHSTDGSTDAEDHHDHGHSHPPVRIRDRHYRGGVRAIPPEDRRLLGDDF